MAEERKGGGGGMLEKIRNVLYGARDDGKGGLTKEMPIALTPKREVMVATYISNLTDLVADHGGLLGLSDDDHTQYALLVGRAVAQTIRGGTGTGDALTLRGGSGNAGYLDIDALKFFDYATNPAVTGRLQRNGVKLLWYDGTAARRVTLHSDADPTNTQVLIHNGTIWVPTTFSGAFTIDNAGVATLATVAVGKGGTGITSGTSGGIPYFSGSTSIASSLALTANTIVLGGGAGVAPFALGALGTTTQVLHGNAGGAPTWGNVLLTADVTGVLPIANGGTNLSSYTAGDLPYCSATNVLSKLAIGTNGLTTLRVASGLPAWGNILGYLAKADTAYSIVAADNGKLIDCTGLTSNRTLTLPAAANLTAGWCIWVRKDTSANLITISQAAAETINGATSNILYGPNACVGIMFDGTNYVVIYANDQVSATGTTAGASGTPTNACSCAIGPGEWDVTGICTFIFGSATTFTASLISAVTTSGTHGTDPLNRAYCQPPTSATVGVQASAVVPPYRLSLTGATTLYAVCQINFTGTSPTLAARVSARRVG